MRHVPTPNSPGSGRLAAVVAVVVIVAVRPLPSAKPLRGRHRGPVRVGEANDGREATTSGACGDANVDPSPGFGAVEASFAVRS